MSLKPEYGQGRSLLLFEISGDKIIPASLKAQVEYE